MENNGYHLTEIKRGEVGEFSKIVEEFNELQDAHCQNSPIMELVEISDLIGAIELYTTNKYNITLAQVLRMKDATERAFKNGYRE